MCIQEVFIFYFVQHISKLNILCFVIFFLDLCQSSKTIVLTMCLVFDSIVLPDRNRLYLFLA